MSAPSVDYTQEANRGQQMISPSTLDDWVTVPALPQQYPVEPPDDAYQHTSYDKGSRSNANFNQPQNLPDGRNEPASAQDGDHQELQGQGYSEAGDVVSSAMGSPRVPRPGLIPLEPLSNSGEERANSSPEIGSSEQRPPLATGSLSQLNRAGPTSSRPFHGDWSILNMGTAEDEGVDMRMRKAKGLPLTNSAKDTTPRDPSSGTSTVDWPGTRAGPLAKSHLPSEWFENLALEKINERKKNRTAEMAVSCPSLGPGTA